MKIPNFVRRILNGYDADIRPLMEATVYDDLRKGRESQGDLSEEDFCGFKAEASAFFFYERREEDSVWSTYFAPTFTATRNDGVEVRIPNIEEFNADTIGHWEMRAAEARHPVLRARYADLVWDLKRRITQQRPDVKFACIAIDAYIEAVQNGLHTMEIEGVHRLERPWTCP
jgi:lysyl-tRNA synthetase class 1